MNIGIVGAGTMGAGIALTALYAGLNVTLYDLAPEVLDKAETYIETFLAKKNQAEAVQRLVLTSELADMAACEIVIEAIIEQREAKQALIRQLDEICTGEAIFATNTSTIAVTTIASASKHPWRVGGMHFFNPAPVMQLVEIIRAVQTDETVITRLTALSETMGKTPIIVNDSPGFIVNRVARPFYLEALRIVQEGIATPQQVDAVMELGAGFRMGPFRLMDLIGLDVNFAASQSMFEQTFYEPRFRPSPLQARMVQANQLGRKTGKGWYDYGDDAPPYTLPTVPDVPPPTEVIYSPFETPLHHLCVSRGCTFTESREKATIWLSRDVLRPPPKDTLLLVDSTAYHVIPTGMIAYDGVVLDGTKVITLSNGRGDTEEKVLRAETFMNGLGLAVIWLNANATEGHVLSRILYQLINEAAFAAGENVAEMAAIDTAMKLGMNFPSGPLEYALKIDLERLYMGLNGLYLHYQDERYRMAPLLTHLSGASEKFK